MNEVSTQQKGYEGTARTHHQMCWIKGTARSLEAQETHNANRKGDEIDYANQGI